MLTGVFNRKPLAERLHRKLMRTLTKPWNNNHSEACFQLIIKGAAVDLKDKKGRLPITEAARNDYKEITWRLLSMNVDINIADGTGNTPLSWASCKGNEDIVRSLLFKGAEPNTQDRFGRTPLMWAATNGRTKIIEHLMASGADPAMRDRDGKNAEALALEHEQKEAAARIKALKAGMDKPRPIIAIADSTILKNDMKVRGPLRFKNRKPKL
jgi:ankyrin repeat protein